LTALELVKSRLKSYEALYLIMDDVQAKKVMVGWMQYFPTCRDFPVKEADDPHGALARLWESLGPLDWEKLAARAKAPASRVKREFERLRAVHLVWPDGTIDSNALVLIQTEVGISLSGVVKNAKAVKR
jgi:hypothetical protein